MKSSLHKRDGKSRILDFSMATFHLIWNAAECSLLWRQTSVVHIIIIIFFFSVLVAAYSSREAEYKNEEMSSLVTVNIIPSRPIIR